MTASASVILTDFDLFWDAFPRKAGKGAARQKFDIATRTTAAQIIMQALAAQKAAGMFSPDLKFVPHPATWLHQQRYDDEVVSSRPAFRNGALEALARSQENARLLEFGGDD